MQDIRLDKIQHCLQPQSSSRFSVNTDYVKNPSFLDFVDNFPDSGPMEKYLEILAYNM